jgi:hypothetical protein
METEQPEPPQIHSKRAWGIAGLYSWVLASETRDLAAHIDLAIDEALELAARIADNGMLVPPDGGSPSEDEIRMAEGIASAIRKLKHR